MHAIQIQVQPERNSSIDITKVDQTLRELDLYFESAHDEENGLAYTSYLVAVSDIEMQWPKIREKLLQVPAFSDCAIVVVEDSAQERGYKLLHHFDPQGF